MQYIRPAAHFLNRENFILHRLLARYPSIGSAILAFFYAFLMRRGGGGLQSLTLASSRDGASDLVPDWSSQRMLPRWHAASSRGSQAWPQRLLLEFSCCLHQYGLYMQINGGSFGGKCPHPGLPECILPSKWMHTHPHWPYPSSYHVMFSHNHTEMLSQKWPI